MMPSVDLYLFTPTEGIPQSLMTHYKFRVPMTQGYILGFKIIYHALFFLSN